MVMGASLAVDLGELGAEGCERALHVGDYIGPPP